MLTGASGITALSPAMSFAGGRLVFSAYENDGYNIYALDTAEQLAGEPSVDLPRNAAVLPPRRDAGGLVVEALQDATWGLPGTEVPVGEPYKPKWGLDFAGQPSFGVGVDPFGTYATGGISLLFSDMLGNHVIGTAAQVSSRFDEFGGDPLLPQSDAPMELGRVHRPDAVRVARLRSRVSSATPTSSASIATFSAISQARAFSRIRSAGPGAWSSPAATAASVRATT